MEALNNLVNRLENENDDELQRSLMSSNTIEIMDSFLNTYGLNNPKKY